MLGYIEPIYVKASAAAFVMCIATIVLMHVFRKVKALKNVELRLFVSVVISAVFSFAFYSFSINQWLSEATTIITYFVDSVGWLFVIPFILIGVLILLAHFLEKVLTPQEFRTFWHIFGGIAIISFAALNRELGFLIVTYVIFGFVVMEYLRRLDEKSVFVDFIKKSFHKAARDNEKRSFMASIFFMIGCFIVLLIFQKQYAIALVLILTLGDASAVITGKKFGKEKWSHNAKKSIQGSLALFLIVMIILLSFKFSFLVALFIAIVVALFESLPLKIGDNLVIPIIASILLIGISNSVANTNYWLYIFPLALAAILLLTKLIDLKSSLIIALFGIMVINGQVSSLAFFFMLVLFIVINSLLNASERVKHKIRIKENAQKIRIVNSVVSSGIIPVFVAVLGNFYYFVGAMSAALSETMARKIGVIYPNPRLITTMKKTKAGTRGAVSFVGYVAIILASLITAAVVIAAAHIFGIELNLWFTVILALICGLGAVTINSIMCAALGFLEKEEIDVLSTISGVAIAAGLVLLL